MVHRDRGFTYLGLIILVAMIGLVGALTLKADSLLQRAAAEEELLETGAAFSAALRSYAAVTPQGQSRQPPSLQELLRDKRFPEPRRHLRKIFIDPITGTTEWGVVYRGDHSGVLAVYSLSQARPLKVANFDARFHNFDNKKHISDWKFTASGQGLLEAGEPEGAPAARKLVIQPEPLRAAADRARAPDEAVGPEAAAPAADETDQPKGDPTPPDGNLGDG